VDFVHTHIYKRLDLARDGVQPSFNKDLQTLSAVVEDIYDPDYLLAKLFWCWIEFEIQELESV
jgi:hypothetical protein